VGSQSLLQQRSCKKMMSMFRGPLLITITVAGTLLAYAVVQKSVSAAFVNSNPRLALILNPNNNGAKLSKIEEELGLRPNTEKPTDVVIPYATENMRAQIAEIRTKGIQFPVVTFDLSPERRTEIKRMTEQALIDDPLDVRALRLMGLIEIDKSRADEFMTRATARSLHDTIANYWLLQRALLSSDYKKTTYYADSILRSNHSVYELIVPILASITSTPEGLEEVKALLRTNPPWRRFFFYGLMSLRLNAKLPLDLFLDMKASGISPSYDELKLYIDMLFRAKLYDLAYDAWLHFLTPDQLQEQTFVFNGTFRQSPTGLPFDWTFEYSGGIRLEIVDAPERINERALLVEFGEGPMGGGAQQILLLSPGTYRLTGENIGSIRARRGFRWRLACLNNLSVPLGQTPAIIGNVPTWQSFSTQFTVPLAACGAQRLRLELDAESESDRLASGSMWFANLMIAAIP
jgi:hypothetical protein